MFYSQIILAKKGPLAKVWLAAHWGDKKLARPQIFATDIAQSVDDICNPSVPLALRVSGHLLSGVVRIYSRKVKYVLNDCTEAMLKLQMASTASSGAAGSAITNPNRTLEGEWLMDQPTQHPSSKATGAGVSTLEDLDQVHHVVEGFCLPLLDHNEWILAEDEDVDANNVLATVSKDSSSSSTNEHSGVPPGRAPYAEEELWVPFDPYDEDHNPSMVSDVEVARAAGQEDTSLLTGDAVRNPEQIAFGKATSHRTSLQSNALSCCDVLNDVVILFFVVFPRADGIPP